MTSFFCSSRLTWPLVAALLLSACSSAVRVPAPVEDRSGVVRSLPPTSAAAAPAIEATKPLPGIENAGKPGYYAVQRGDTLTRIGLEHGQAARDLARWNNLANPDVIEVGQVLRVVPPGAAVEAAGVVVRPVPPPVQSPPVVLSSEKESTPNKEPTKEAASKASLPSNGLQFIWPTQGRLIGKFDATSKGIEIAGKKGDVVVAAEAGKVAYVGESLRGYGKLILIKHNGYLTAYGHNDKFAVKEDQVVAKGQKIAEMGNTDADAYKLKFEIRDAAGKALNPVNLLPQR